MLLSLCNIVTIFLIRCYIRDTNSYYLILILINYYLILIFIQHIVVSNQVKLVENEFVGYHKPVTATSASSGAASFGISGATTIRALGVQAPISTVQVLLTPMLITDLNSYHTPGSPMLLTEPTPSIQRPAILPGPKLQLLVSTTIAPPVSDDVFLELYRHRNPQLTEMDHATPTSIDVSDNESQDHQPHIEKPVITWTSKHSSELTPTASSNNDHSDDENYVPPPRLQILAPPTPAEPSTTSHSLRQPPKPARSRDSVSSGRNDSKRLNQQPGQLVRVRDPIDLILAARRVPKTPSADNKEVDTADDMEVDTAVPSESGMDIDSVSDSHMSIESSRVSDSMSVDYFLSHGFVATTSTPLHAPNTYKQAMSASDLTNWQIAMDNEMDAHYKNITWTLCDLPESRKAIGNRRVFTIKDGGKYCCLVVWVNTTVEDIA